MSVEMQQTDVSQITISEEFQRQHSTPVESISGTSSQLGHEDHAPFPLSSCVK